MVVDLDRGRQPHCHLIDISHLTELHYINEEENGLRLGGGVTHAEVLKSKLVKAQANILAQAAVEVGAPQIRNRSTLSGNIVTASPAADTVPPLLALAARVELESVRGKREVTLQEFITGFRQVGLAEDEMLVSIFIPRATGERRGAFLKLGLRNAQAISVISVAVNLEFDAEGKVIKAGLALGSVAPTVIRAPLAEEILRGKVLTDELIAAAAIAAMETAKPIADVRGSAEYRKAMVKVFTARALRYVRDGKTPPPSADPDIFLQLPEVSLPTINLNATGERSEETIELTLNGKPTRLEKAGDMALLYALRQAGFNGTKEGCLEGECGACTVLLNGKAVDSCLVPAPSAHGAEVVTIEGLAQGEKLHPLQQSFIDMGGVQCGYCTPGLILSGSTLLAECPEGADEWQCRSALVGNLCRCTGYGRVLAAMQEAQKVVKHGGK
jgi:carbon-monoxide dehydrogenase medium subunit